MRRVFIKVFLLVLIIFSNIKADDQMTHITSANSWLLGDKVVGIAFDGTYLWASIRSHHIQKYDNDTNPELGWPASSYSTGVSYSNGYIFQGANNYLVKIDIQTHAITKYNIDGIGDVKAAVLDENGNIWAAGTSALKKLPSGSDTWETVFSDYCYDVVIDGNGNIWVGTNTNGVKKFDGVNWTTYAVAEGLPHASVRKIDVEGNRVWVATGHDLAYTDNGGGNWTTVVIDGTWNGRACYSLDIKGNKIFVGTVDGFVFSLDGGNNWTRYNTSNSALPNDKIYNVVAENEYKIWLNPSSSTEANGLVLYELNQSPNQPANPDPANNANNVNASNLILSWQCDDPDNDELVYDIYFGENNPPTTLVAQNHNSNSYNPDNLGYNKVYYWKVVAKDDQSQTEGPVWSFSTSDNSSPSKPVITNEVSEGNRNVSYSFQITSSDPENENIYYYIDWRDSTITNWAGPYSSGQQVTFTHRWHNLGAFTVFVKAKDVNGAESAPDSVNITIVNLKPNVPIVSISDTTLFPDSSAIFSFYIKDNDNDSLYLKIDWGDNEGTSWEGPYPSDTTIVVEKMWQQTGLYPVKAMVKDVYDAESEWSTAKNVLVNTIPEIVSISGDSIGIENHNIQLEIEGYDNENDLMYAKIDWGDGTITDFSDSFSNNEKFIATHNYGKSGKFHIKVQIKDSKNYISEWYDAYTILINKNRSLQVLAPDNGEEWEAGKNEYIKWIMFNLKDSVNIFISYDNGESFDTIITAYQVEQDESKLIDTLSFLWHIPDTIIADSCWIKVESATDSLINDILDEPFSILEKRTITILSPLPNDTLSSKEEIQIKWESTGKIENIAAAYSLDGGKNFVLIDDVISNNGEFLWSAPDTNSNAILKIWDSKDDSVNYIIDSSFHLYNNWISFYNEFNFNSVERGSNIYIMWNYGGIFKKLNVRYVDSLNNISIDVLKYFYVKKERFLWKIPDTLPVTDNAHLEFTSADFDDVYYISKRFNIVEKRTISVLEPSLNDSLIVGTKTSVQWATTGLIDSVEIFYKYSERWIFIARVENSGVYEWNIPNCQLDSTYIKIQSIDKQVIAYSNKFVIYEPVSFSISSFSQNSFLSGSNFSLSWSNTGKCDFVNIYISIDSGKTYSIVEEKIDNRDKKTYDFNLPHTKTEKAYIKIASFNDTTINTLSSPFEIYAIKLTEKSLDKDIYLSGDTLKLSIERDSYFGKVNVFFKDNPASDFISIGGINSDVFNWLVPDTIESKKCFLKVSFDGDSTAFSILNNPFVIYRKPIAQILLPEEDSLSIDFGKSLFLKAESFNTIYDYKYFWKLSDGTILDTIEPGNIVFRNSGRQIVKHWTVMDSQIISDTDSVVIYVKEPEIRTKLAFLKYPEAHIKGNRAVFSWKNNLKSFSILYYGLSDNELTDTVILDSFDNEHDIVLKNLDNNHYYYQVMSYIENDTIYSDIEEFTIDFVSITDTIKPEIIDINVFSYNDKVILNISFSEPVKLDLYYGESLDALNKKISKENYSSNFSIYIDSLEPNSIYYFKLVVSDILGNSLEYPESMNRMAKLNKLSSFYDAESGFFVFNTINSFDNDAPKFLIEPETLVKNFGYFSVYWKTNEPVSYKLISLVDNKVIIADSLNFYNENYLILNGLNSNIYYNYRLILSDANGNSTNKDFLFKTSETLPDMPEVINFDYQFVGNQIEIKWETDKYSASSIRWITNLSSQNSYKYISKLSKKHSVSIRIPKDVNVVYFQIKNCYPGNIFCSEWSELYYVATNVTDISENINKQESNFHFKVYPNPFKDRVLFKFGLKSYDDVELKIYNLLGRVIYSKKIFNVSQGYNVLYWNGRDNEGREQATGIYLYELKIGKDIKKGKLLYVK